jgi:hypothetical protein
VLLLSSDRKCKLNWLLIVSLALELVVQEAWDCRGADAAGRGMEAGAQMCLVHARQTLCSMHTLDTHAHMVL